MSEIEVIGRREHLRIIQETISRLSTFSFGIKVMAVINNYVYLATANNYVGLHIVLTVLFWFLDTYYLQQERKFRGVYNNVCRLKNDVEIKPWEMPIQKFQGGQYCFWRVFFSKTIVWAYATFLGVLLCTIK